MTHPTKSSARSAAAMTLPIRASWHRGGSTHPGWIVGFLYNPTFQESYAVFARDNAVILTHVLLVDLVLEV